MPATAIVLLNGLGLEVRPDIVADAIRRETTVGGQVNLQQFVAIARGLMKVKRYGVPCCTVRVHCHVHWLLLYPMSVVGATVVHPAQRKRAVHAV